jgi:formylglycine-generating enzyme required for sulfatase activity
MTRLTLLSLVVLLHAGCVDQRCYEQADCPAPKICGPTGTCEFECSSTSDCDDGFKCTDHHCEPDSIDPFECPVDMVAVADTFCMDRYEASRADATANNAGTDGSSAHSVAGVRPWQVLDNATAQAACEQVDKRLCSANEWQFACEGSNKTVYVYGNEYEPQTCNGIDAFGRDSFHLAPTGDFADCQNEWGVFDLNGNLWEHTADGSDQTVRGGAYNCGDSAALHRCSYVPGWVPSARGFRCCLTPVAPAQGPERT